MSGAWELYPHPDGPWLLRRGERCYAVDRERASSLAADPGILDAAFARSPDMRAGRRRGVRRWLTILPAGLARRLSAPLSPFCGWTSLATLAAGGAVLMVAAARCGAPIGIRGPSDAAVAWILLVGLNLLHELGHAGALRRCGYPPGAIGLGRLGFLPVLWCDVTPVVLLPSRDRARVDAAGVCWQLGGAGLLAAIGALSGRPAPGTAAVAALVSAGWSLLPVLRLDGYWLLRDLLDADPEAPAPPGAGPMVRLLLSCVRLLQLALLARAVVLAWTLAGAVRLAPSSPPAVVQTAIAAVGAAIIGALVWAGIGRARLLAADLSGISRRARRRNPSVPPA